MLTANDLRKAQLHVVKKGYDPTEVDNLLDGAADAISALAREKDELEGKIALLAERIEEYRADEDKIKTTLLGAQRMSDTIIKEAKQKGDILLRDASIKAERVVEASTQRLEDDKQAFVTLKKEVANFKKDILNIYKNHLEVLSLIPGYDDEPDDIPEEPVEEEETFEAPLAVHQPEVVNEQPVVENKENEVVAGFYDDFEKITAAGEQNDEGQLTLDDEPIVESVDEPTAINTDDKSDDKFGKLDFGESFDFNK